MSNKRSQFPEVFNIPHQHSIRSRRIVHDSTTNDDYLAHMAHHSSWPDQYIMRAISLAFNTWIFIYSHKAALNNRCEKLHGTYNSSLELYLDHFALNNQFSLLLCDQTIDPPSRIVTIHSPHNNNNNNNNNNNHNNNNNNNNNNNHNSRSSSSSSSSHHSNSTSTTHQHYPPSPSPPTHNSTNRQLAESPSSTPPTDHNPPPDSEEGQGLP